MITKASVVTVGATNRSQSGKVLKERFLEKTGIDIVPSSGGFLWSEHPSPSRFCTHGRRRS